MATRSRVILNDRVLYRPLTGVGHYTNQLLRAMGAMDLGDLEVRPFLRQFVSPPPHDPTCPPGPAGPGRRRRETEWVRGVVRRMLEPPYELAFRVAARYARLYHEPNHIPVESGTPTVTTVHDISVLTNPQWHPEHRVRWYERRFERGRRQTTRFIAASEFTRRELVNRLGIAADRIDVTLQAARPEFTPRSSEEIARACASLELPQSFFLFVGTLEPRKNVSTLLEAHAALPADVRRTCPLVLVGAWGWKNEALDELLRARQAAGELRLLGYVSNEVLACLYSACTALTWPSLYEGFGLPPLEAMACGAPVIVSDVTSIPEVVGGAGMLLDPHDVRAWTEAMWRMVEDVSWRANWRKAGRERSAAFSWRRCAEETIACYRKALEQC